PHDLSPDADDFGMPRAQVIGDVTLMLTLEWFRHQQLDVLPDDLRRRVTEFPLCRWVESLDGAVFVDGDDPLNRMVHNGAHSLLGLPKFGLGPLALGNVPDDAGEVAFITHAELADGQIHREGGTILAPPDHFSTDPDDLRPP